MTAEATLFAESLLRARLAANFSQQKAADAIGISLSTFKSWVQNKSVPTPEKQAAALAALAPADPVADEVAADVPRGTEPVGTPVHEVEVEVEEQGRPEGRDGQSGLPAFEVRSGISSTPLPSELGSVESMKVVGDRVVIAGSGGASTYDPATKEVAMVKLSPANYVRWRR